ncbi:HIRAN domain-containing protein [Egicoccus halophilus]|uniref:HIRAN domain-containing protein n=1 Tax=Egicoccus halophilus TaxID=1670830 RepID=A0A8J3A9B7_9ACTN|nr:HIRAN domain-containing protein [Egicoccus halophilus]GGI05029.1 hypothetical protein GCM10011354_12040 [Egicoccus halophilus]
MTDLRHTAAASAPSIGAALRAFRTPVRGHAFAARPPEAAPLQPGRRLALRREPDNPVDPLAVAVWTSPADGEAATAWRVGYLDRQVAARLTPRLDAGLRVEARLDGWIAEPQGRWRRPVVLLRPGTAATPPLEAPSRPRSVRALPADRPGLWGRPPGVRIRPVN